MEKPSVIKNALAWLIALSLVPCAAAPVVSGDYEGLLIGVDRNGVLTGYFESSTGAGKFNCIFFISGKLNDTSGRVDTWFPKDRDPKMVIQGVLKGSAEDEYAEISLRLKEEHGGCGNVQRFEPEPASFPLTEKGGWQSIAVVAAPKAFFYDSPASVKPRKAFVVLGNGLRIYETRGDWVKAEYVSEDNRRTRGWIRKRDLFSTHTPLAKPSR